MITILLLVTAFLLPGSQLTEYDPLKVSGKTAVTDAEFQYGSPAREVPLRIYLPELHDAAPVILFSHGLGGSRENNQYLGDHWAGRGYVVVVMQHAGSDVAVWKDVSPGRRLTAMKAAASGQSFLSRVQDVTATLDQLKKWNTSDTRFAGRFDLQRVGMSGHSFGAVTTQAVSGQNFGRRGQQWTDRRIKAAVALSPSEPAIGGTAETFAKVRIPWLLMTGTEDKSVISRTTPEDRRKVFQQLPASGHFYELVLDQAQHMAFSDRTLLGRQQRNPNHHRVIKALSTAFWDSCLREQSDAQQWLNGSGAKSVLESKDQWQRK